MRKRRRTLLVALAAVALGLTGYAGWQAFTSGHRINKATFHQIGSGMTLAEVEALLGAPPGNYAPPELSEVIEAINAWADADSPEPRVETWWSEDGGVIVTFHPDGTGEGAQFIDVRGGKPPFLERVRQRFGW
jgi:hypothetical protein